jgi:hypothetical protein
MVLLNNHIYSKEVPYQFNSPIRLVLVVSMERIIFQCHHAHKNFSHINNYSQNISEFRKFLLNTRPLSSLPFLIILRK